MSDRDVVDGQEVFDRIGAACDRIGAAHPQIALAVGAYARERRGVLRACGPDVGGRGRITAEHVARDLMELAEGAERLADQAEAPDQRPPSARVGSVRLLLDVTPLLGGVQAVPDVNVVVRRADGVAIARGRGPLQEAMASLGRALHSDSDVAGAIMRAAERGR